MADPSSEVPLPSSVEEMLRRICEEQSLPPPDSKARMVLASLGEEPSLKLLRNISGCRIRTLSGLITYMAKKSEYVQTQESACFSTQQSSSSSGSTSPQDEAISHPSSSGQSTTQTSPPSLSLERPSRPTFSPHLMALGELEFRKAFLILSYIGNGEWSNKGENIDWNLAYFFCRKRLEDVIEVNVITKMKNLPMAQFESEVWSVMGRQCIEEIDRQKVNLFLRHLLLYDALDISISSCKIEMPVLIYLKYQFGDDMDIIFVLVLDWDSGKTYIYHCYVYPDGSYLFKGPYLDKKITHLQRVLGADNVLNVKFLEEVTDRNTSALSFNSSNAGYLKIAKEGILVGLRRYRFFVFKDGGKEEKKKNPASSPVKCYFVCMESHASSDEKNQCILFKKTIREARCLFMHVHKVSSMAKYMARFSLILSKTVKLEVDLATVFIEMIEDTPCRDEDGDIVKNEDGNPLIHTDGTGFISEDLALECLKNTSKVSTSIRKTSRFVILMLFQNSLVGDAKAFKVFKDQFSCPDKVEGDLTSVIRRGRGDRKGIWRLANVMNHVIHLVSGSADAGWMCWELGQFDPA
ncbi:hypothetical protein HHK36_021678 [Tetracentron sinense]|uniref:RNA-dependent RNA polymerase n=1 Tax=Tetracentron sinense TaxID=13715 RepID=A0A834YQ76_TETSI|nr:hypothetical protein HHK36_021678 [Tetracentron sinense]